MAQQYGLPRLTREYVKSRSQSRRNVRDRNGSNFPLSPPRSIYINAVGNSVGQKYITNNGDGAAPTIKPLIETATSYHKLRIESIHTRRISTKVLTHFFIILFESIAKIRTCIARGSEALVPHHRAKCSGLRQRAGESRYSLALPRPDNVTCAHQCEAPLI